jgi:hypothetical protein
VEVVRLRLNYRCGSNIVTASSYALGEDRDYAAPPGASQGTIYFHPRNGTFDQQADYLFTTLWPQMRARIPDLRPGHVAVLYSTAQIGNAVHDAAVRAGFQTLRTDGNAIYPRANKLMRWLETCAVWCCGGWRTGSPKFSKIFAEACRYFSETLTSDEVRLRFRRDLLEFLWFRQDGNALLHDWLDECRENVLQGIAEGTRTIQDDLDVLSTFIERTSVTGNLSDMKLSQFAGQGVNEDRFNLSTLHSAKGREFRVVVLFGMNQRTIPRNNAGVQGIREARRLFYVGFTRPKTELYLMYSALAPSVFVAEVQQRLHTK